MEKKLDGNNTRILRAILNMSSTKEQQYGHLSPITKTIQVRRTRHAGHCWRSGDELISDILPWIPSHRQAKVGWAAWTYLQQLCDDWGCSLEYLLVAMDNRDGWREMVRKIRAGSTTWWRWWWYIYIYVCVCNINRIDKTKTSLSYVFSFFSSSFFLDLRQ